MVSKKFVGMYEGFIDSSKDLIDPVHEYKMHYFSHASWPFLVALTEPGNDYLELWIAVIIRQKKEDSVTEISRRKQW